MLISSDYASQNAKLHETNPHYGAWSHRWADYVLDLMRVLEAATIVDYGCGKATLARAMAQAGNVPAPLTLTSYDPAIPKYAQAPEPADLVVCTDVLEHIEPDCLGDVLADIRRCTVKAAFVVIATRPSSSFLPDGRNAHLIQKGAQWWLPRLRRNFTPWRTQTTRLDEVMTLLRPR